MSNKYLFQSLMKVVEDTVKYEEGKNYAGLGSIALKLTNMYMSNYRPMTTGEYMYLKTADLVLIDLLEWLSSNYEQCKGQFLFNFADSFKKAEQELMPYKKKLFYRWCSGELEEDFRWLKMKLRLNKTTIEKAKSTTQTWYRFLEEFSKFDSTKIYEFKKEIGL
jgi:hypothetical protein